MAVYLRSQALDMGEKPPVTFLKEGETAYDCALHLHMKGKVLVKL